LDGQNYGCDYNKPGEGMVFLTRICVLFRQKIRSRQFVKFVSKILRSLRLRVFALNLRQAKAQGTKFTPMALITGENLNIGGT